MNEAKLILQDSFDGSDETSLTVTIFFGVQELNNSRINIWDPADIGTPVMRNDFDPTS